MHSKRVSPSLRIPHLQRMFLLSKTMHWTISADDPQHQGVLECHAAVGYKEGEHPYCASMRHEYARKSNNTPELIAQQAEIVLEKVNEYCKTDVLISASSQSPSEL